MMTYSEFEELIREKAPPVPTRPPTMGEEVAADWDELVEASVQRDALRIARAELELVTGPIADFIGSIADVLDPSESMVTPEGVVPYAWERTEHFVRGRAGGARPLRMGRPHAGRTALRGWGGPIAMGGQITMEAAYAGLTWADALTAYLATLVGYSDTLARVALQAEESSAEAAPRMPNPIVPDDMRRHYAGFSGDLHIEAYRRGHLSVHEVIAGADAIRPVDRHPSREYFIRLRDEHSGSGHPDLRRTHIRRSIVEELIGLDREALGLGAGYRLV